MIAGGAFRERSLDRLLEENRMVAVWEKLPRRPGRSEAAAQARSPSNALAAFRSGVSNPSVNPS